MALFYTDKAGVDTSYTDPDIGDATTEEMMKMYRGWEPQVEALIKVWSLSVFAISSLIEGLVHAQPIASLGSLDAETARDVGRRGRDVDGRRGEFSLH